MFRSYSKYALAVVTCLLIAGTVLPLHKSFASIISVGETVPLSQLLGAGGDTIVVGDKSFDEFFYAPTGGAPDAEGVSVTGVDQDGGIGLVFTSGGFAAGGFHDFSLDASLGFRVSVTDPNQVIIGAELFGTAGTLGSGDARISEAFSNVPDASLLIRRFELEGDVITSKTSDQAHFANGVKELFVIKDISIEVPDASSDLFDLANLAELTTFRQLFFQEEVPEPATVSLAAFAIVCVVCSRNRK